ncbi:unnamed protein product [Dibothriocephalus latus]|uniref:Uncharacterized protein n=1 Tax=Dibothriocephalus latus TaxID=60516 RepID=A0A3P7LT46_DIBLA|nr:unnamed protein product [Dibothriocephalus latus]
MPIEDDAAQKLYRVPPGYNLHKAKQKPPQRKPKKEKNVKVPEVLVDPPAPVLVANMGAPISSFESTVGTDTLMNEIKQLNQPINRPSLVEQSTVSDSVDGAKTTETKILLPPDLMPQSQPTSGEVVAPEPTNAAPAATSEAAPQLATESQKNSQASEQILPVGQLQILTPKPSNPQSVSAVPTSTPTISGTPVQPKLTSNHSSQSLPNSTPTSSISVHSNTGSMKTVTATRTSKWTPKWTPRGPPKGPPKVTPPPKDSRRVRFSSRLSSIFSRMTGSSKLPDKKDLIDAKAAAEIERAQAEYEEELLRRTLEELERAREAALQAKIERFLASRRGKKMIARKQAEMQTVMHWMIQTMREFHRTHAAFDDSEEEPNPELMRKLRALHMLETLFMPGQRSICRSRSGSRCSRASGYSPSCHSSNYQSPNTGADPRRCCIMPKPCQFEGRRKRRKKLCWTLISMLESRGIDVQGEIARDMQAMEEEENEEQEVEEEEEAPRSSSTAHASRPG